MLNRYVDHGITSSYLLYSTQLKDHMNSISIYSKSLETTPEYQHLYEILSQKEHNPHFLKRYIKFILWSRTFTFDDDVYTEKHHICPRSMFKEYENFKEHPWNCVVLPYRMHIDAHILLWMSFGSCQAQAIQYIFNTIDCNIHKDKKIITKIQMNYLIKTRGLNIKGKKFFNNGKETKAFNLNDLVPDGFIKGHIKGHCKNTKWYNNGIINKRFYKEDIIPKDFIIGKITKSNEFKKCYNNGNESILISPEETIPEGYILGGLSDHNSGRVWFNDGNNNILLKKSDLVPDGFVSGRTYFNKEGSFYNNGTIIKKFSIEEIVPDGFVKGFITNAGLGRTHYNNGVVSLMLLPDDIIPDGFIKGSLTKPLIGKVCFNDGLINKYFSLNETIPEGYVKGMLRRKPNVQQQVS